MRITHANLVDAVTYITPSSADVDYPVTNIQDQRLATKWKSDTASTQTVIIDLGSAQDITTLAVLGHNLVATGTTVIGNSVVGGTALSMVWEASGQSSVQTIVYNEDVMLKFVEPMTYRYWKFTFTGLTSALEVARLWLGTYLTINPSSLLDFKVTYKNSDINIYGKDRAKFSIPGVVWRKFEFSFPPTESTMINSISDLIDEIGFYKSVIFTNFDTDFSYSIVYPSYCSIVGNSVGFRHTEYQKYTYAFSLEEDK